MTASRGKLFVFSAPSGAGKTTLVRRVMGERPDLTFSISYTTRPKRDGEVNERDYHFLDRATFERMRDANEFLEHADVFGNYYGTGRDQVESLRNAGRDVLLEIDWQGAQQVRRLIPASQSIFILPPSRATLQKRLTSRGQDGPDIIQRRMSEAVEEISHYSESDYLVINDEFELALSQLQAIVNGQRLRTQIIAPTLSGLLEDLLS